MYNFFFKDADHSLFRKALKSTKDEAVIINILSTDSSLVEDSKKEAEAPVVRKNLSNKFQPSPFGKFFGPRKQRTTPVDMGNFSSWRNKNFREVEQKLGETPVENTTKFSLSDFMNKSAEAKKYNDEDQLKADKQKPITQLDTDDPTYRKYSLDSYLHKLEEQAKVKDKFQANDDLLEPLGETMQNVVPDSSQDENFGLESAVNVEDFTFDENIKGERFAFETSELDKVRSRLDKLERESQNIKDKPSDRVISGEELTDLAGGKDEKFDLSKLGDDDEIEVDDIERINEKLMAEQDESENKEKPKVDHKRFFEINKTPTGAPARAISNQSETTGSDETADETKALPEEENIAQQTEILDNPEQEVTTDGQTIDSGVDAIQEGEGSNVVDETKLARDDVLTKDDLRVMTDELVSKFTEMYQKGNDQDPVQAGESLGQVGEAGEENGEGLYGYDGQQPYADGSVPYALDSSQANYASYGQPNDYIQQQQVELQAKILEMIESNKRADAEALEKLRQAELEKNRVAEEYEGRLRELEASFRKRDEEMKKQAYLDKLKSDIKLKKAENNYRRREEEFKELEKVSTEHIKIGIVLQKELENNLNVSNLEMDKKLLEVASKIRKEELEKQKIEQPVQQVEVDEVEEVEVEEVPKTPKKTPAKKRTTRRTTRSHTRTPRRKIDSDIIGGINFD